MTRFHSVIVASGLVLALCGGAAQAQPAQDASRASKPMLTLQMPALPDPVRVTLKPATTALLTPIVMTIPLQLLAYYIAVRRGCDVDQPRNLAKSVTVE